MIINRLDELLTCRKRGTIDVIFLKISVLSEEQSQGCTYFQMMEFNCL